MRTLRTNTSVRLGVITIAGECQKFQRFGMNSENSDTPASSPRSPGELFRQRLRESFRQMLGIDEVNDSEMLFTHHRRLLAHGLELTLLLVLLAPALIVTLADAGFEIHARFSGSPTPWINSNLSLAKNVERLLTGVAPLAGVQFLVLGGMLMLMRFFRRGWLLALCLMLWTVGAYAGLIYYGGTWQTWLRISSPGGWPAELGPRPIPVPTISFSLYGAVMLIMAILGALTAVRGGYAHWKWIIGTITGLLLSYFLMGFDGTGLLSLRGAAALTLTVLFSFVFARLPLTRKLLEGYTGIELRPGGGTQETGINNPFQALGLTVVFSALVLIHAGGFVLTHLTKDLGKRIANGPPVPHRPAALINAQSILGEAYVRKSVSWRSATKVTEDPVRELIGRICSFHTPQDVLEVLDEVSLDEIEAAFSEIDDYIQPFLDASNVDYYQPNAVGLEGPVYPDFIAFRTVTRLLGGRAVCCANTGRTEEALRYLQAGYGLGYLLIDSGYSLVVVIIGTVMQNVTNNSTWSIWAAWRNDPERLTHLLDMLNSIERDVHCPYPGKQLVENQFGAHRVAVAFEYVIPGIQRQINLFYARWISYDQLRILTAMDLYRHETGNWPSKQEDLVPKYLPRVLRDPERGMPYLLGSRVILNSDGTPTGESEPTVDQGGGPMIGELPLTPSSLAPGSLNDALEEYRKAVGKEVDEEQK